ncbi:hypothetical protein ACT6QH_02090 [Xanthobacter sp. TB0139]|uniref:hypothetical protein n=1 Tax=Xanthobacter sp. TB0139 TaxID=3459178 RepID=UPI00403940F0
MKRWVWAAAASVMGAFVVANLNHAFVKWRGDALLTTMIEGVFPTFYAIATSFWGQISAAALGGLLVGIWVDAIGRRWDARAGQELAPPLSPHVLGHAPEIALSVSSQAKPEINLVDEVHGPAIDGDAAPVFEGWDLSRRSDYDFKPDRLHLRARKDDAKIEISAFVLNRNSGPKRLVVRLESGEFCINDMKSQVKCLDGEVVSGGRQSVEFHAISIYMELEYISGSVELCLDFGYSELDISNRIYVIWQFKDIVFPDKKHELMTIGYIPHVRSLYYRR